jgi:hypothetical protein
MVLLQFIIFVFVVFRASSDVEFLFRHEHNTHINTYTHTKGILDFCCRVGVGRLGNVCEKSTMQFRERLCCSIELQADKQKKIYKTSFLCCSPNKIGKKWQQQYTLYNMQLVVLHQYVCVGVCAHHNEVFVVVVIVAFSIIFRLEPEP